MEIELPEACKICLANANPEKKPISVRGPYWHVDHFKLCKYGGGNGCLPKDMAMIVLLDKLLKK